MDTLTPTLLPVQSKMARALLSWTQKDLAANAKVAVSTVADFERGHRAPMGQNLEAMRAALVTAGIVFNESGEVSPVNRPPVRRMASGLGGPRTIGIGDLRVWAERQDIRGSLQELVSRLVLAETGFAAQVRFPSGEGMSFRGWDGICVFDGPPVPGGYVPEGNSVWEIGSGGDPVGKARDDIATRVAQTTSEERSFLDLRFVSPREFENKDKWAQKKERDGTWRSLRVLDEADLVHWLDRHPPVAAWLAVRIGKARADVRPLADWWEEWSKATRPPFSPDVVRASRDSEAAALQRWLLKDDAEPIPPHYVLAGSAAEAVAFLYASIAQLPPDFARPHLVRAVVAETASAARELELSPTPLIVVLMDAPSGLAVKLSNAGHHVYVALGSMTGRLDTLVTLSPPREDAISDALEGMELPKDLAEQLARDCGQSLLSLQLLMSCEPGEAPEWAKSEPGNELVTALLVGAWDERNPADGKVIERLSGRQPQAYSKSVERWLNVADGPLRRYGDRWSISSTMAAWQRLARYISASNLSTFELVAVEAFRGDLTVSNGMRGGIAAILAIMALHPQHSNGEADVAGSAARVIYGAFRQSEGSAWKVSADELATLAEAAPKPFLDTLQADLEAAQPSVASLFSEWRSDPHSLLRALQMLAREPMFLQDAGTCLFKLAAFDDGKPHSYNRPLHALRNIFSLWLPQTAATLKARLRTLGTLREIGDNYSWRLLTSLIPGVPDAIDMAPNPRWRGLSYPPSETAAPQAIWEGYAIIADWLIEDAAGSIERWENLADMLPRFDADRREAILAGSVRLAETTNEPGLRDNLRKALRRLLHNHRRAKGSWGLEETSLIPLQAAYEQLEPTDPIERLVWLFEHGLVWVPDPSEDVMDEIPSLTQTREKALTELYLSRGDEGLLLLARVTKQPVYVGYAAAGCKIDQSAKRRMLGETIRSTEDSLRRFAQGMMASMFGHDVHLAEQILADAKRERWATDRVVDVFQELPYARSTWEAVATYSDEVEDAYWKRVLALRLPDSEPADLYFAVRKMVGVGRAPDALVLVHAGFDKLETDFIADVLEKAAENDFGSDRSGNAKLMFEHHVTEILKRLDGRADLPAERLVELELAHIETLSQGIIGSYGRVPMALYRRLASDPEMFAKFIQDAFRPERGSGVDADAAEASPEVIRKSMVAQQILNSWDVLPGSGSSEVDRQALKLWVNRAKVLCAAAGRRYVADHYIGRLLARAPKGKDDIWPCEAVRELIEGNLGGDVENSIVTGLFNNRGATWWSPYEGGDPQRDDARKFRRWADTVMEEWPKTGGLLNRIAEMWSGSGKQFDQLGDIARWR